ncbi:MAG: site-specific integrase [archaeon]
MKTDEQTLQDYISRLPAQIGEHNASLMKTFIAKYQALPSEPSTKRLILVVLRLKSISIMMNNAPLDALTEQDIMNLNTAMRKKGMLSAQDYRKTLRRFLRLTDKKKYYDLLESDYLKAAPKKANERLLVDADTFWSQEEINRYLYQSKEHSPMQATWASLWLGTGCRPHELLNLTKKDVDFDGNYLTVKVQGGKTGKRTIVLNNDSGKGMWNYILPYWQTLKDEDKTEFSLPTLEELEQEIKQNAENEWVKTGDTKDTANTKDTVDTKDNSNKKNTEDNKDTKNTNGGN